MAVNAHTQFQNTTDILTITQKDRQSKTALHNHGDHGKALFLRVLFLSLQPYCAIFAYIHPTEQTWQTTIWNGKWRSTGIGRRLDRAAAGPWRHSAGCC